MIRCGGTGDLKDADAEIQAMCDQLKADISKNAKYAMFKALHYKSQVVAGTNYFVKIQVADSGECIHARIFKPLPCNADEGLSVTSVLEGKIMTDVLEYF